MKRNILKNTLNYGKFIVLLFFILVSLVSIDPKTTFAQATPTTFSTPGSYTYTVPSGVSMLKVKIWGAGGGGGNSDITCTGFIFSNCNNWAAVGGAGGGYSEAIIPVTQGEIFDVTVGAGGQTTPVASMSPYILYSTYNSNPSFTDKSAGSSILKSRSSNQYIGAGGGSSGFTTPGKFPVAYPVSSEFNAGSLHGRGALGVVGGTGAGLAGKITSWCGDGNGNIASNCIRIPGGGSGFGTYSGITSIQGSSPSTPNPFPSQITKNVPGGAGAMGGIGGNDGVNGKAPGGGGGVADSASITKGGDGKVYIEPVAQLSFDFKLSNDGNKVITAGNNISSVITTTSLSPLTNGDVTLNIDSITNSSGASVKDIANGIAVGGSSFSGGKIVTPNPVSNTNLTLYTYSTTPKGLYTVTVSGTYKKSSVVNGSQLKYPCSIVFVTDPQPNGNNQYDGFYFGCSTESGFNPQTDYDVNGGLNSTKCINFDDGSCKVVGQNAYLANSSGAQKVVDFRRSLALRECGLNNYTMSGNEQSASTYFTCNSAPTVSTNNTSVITRTTTFNVTVQSPLVYNLATTPSADSCKSSDLNVKLTWSAISGASSYNLYRTRSGTSDPVVIRSVAGTSYTDTTIVYNTLYTYKVAAIVSGAEQISSSDVNVYSPKYLTGSQCPQPTVTPIVKLFTKKTADKITNLALYDLATVPNATNSVISIPLGAQFDLKWVSNLTPDYTCRQITVTPSATTDNTIWSYGNTTGSIVTGLWTYDIDTGAYQLKLSCTNGTNTVLSNIVSVTIQDPLTATANLVPCANGQAGCFEVAPPPPVDAINYGLQVTSSGDKCFANDLSLTQSWNNIGADSYTVTRTRTSPSETVKYTVKGSENTEKYPTFSTDTKYTYTVTATVGGKLQSVSPAVTVTSPKLTTTNCPTPQLTLGIKRSTDSSYSTAIDISKGDTFMLNWSSTGIVGGYTCTNAVIKPDGSNGNSIWTWGNSLSGISNTLTTSQSSVILGSYSFVIHCNSTTGLPSLDSNSVQLGLRSLTIVDLCQNIAGSQSGIPSGLVSDGNGNCIDPNPGVNTSNPNVPPNCTLNCPAPPPTTNPLSVVLFLGNSSIANKSLSSTVEKNDSLVVPYKVKKGNPARIKYISSLSSDYSCAKYVYKPDNTTVNELYNLALDSSHNNIVQTISTSDSEPILYTIKLVCRSTDTSKSAFNSNAVKLLVTDSLIEEI